jgi:hypothetical protein
MKQLAFDFYQNTKLDEAQSLEALKSGLEEYIKSSGLCAYKDFYMQLKNGEILVPENVTHDSYVSLAREVYERRAAEVERQKKPRQAFRHKEQKQ